ncbi:MAG: orotidine-5'-phosphate decarboxylase [Rickettsiales bacterium]|nr:orotidine-5'-phosphate decarboxylase [Rickettsiales bacterium]OUV80969.1 MAG: orotidine-5'-phosphate decarboxylase [Rickettsiales bacterium TMED131]|tara:strand:+ start:225 stop:938 length:714 start_codon:yes stop_codon:yes gene_type:complete
MTKSNNIICALDFNDIAEAINFVASIKYDIVYKVGMEFFFNHGLEGIKKLNLVKNNLKIFLDLKLHDIPNTVSMGLQPLLRIINPYMLTLHVAGGKKMLQEAVRTVNNMSHEKRKPILLGVTILTSLNNADLQEMGHSMPITEYVKRYAGIAKEAGLEGIVCSPLEIKIVKELFQDTLKVVTPGIRMEKKNDDDQARFMTPGEAFKQGADFIVMGRPLIKSNQPNDLISNIINYQHE